MRSPSCARSASRSSSSTAAASDATVQRARLRADHVLSAPRGRALQMNAGAAKATGDVLLFLHADTRLPAEAERLVLDGLARSDTRLGPLRRHHRRAGIRCSGSSPP